MLVYVEADGERAFHGSLELRPEQEAPVRVIATRREQRPACRDVTARLALEHSRQVEDVAAILGFDPEADR